MRHECLAPGDGGLVEIDVRDNCPVDSLAIRGRPRTVRSVDGQWDNRSYVPGRIETGSVIDSFLTAHPEAELAAMNRVSLSFRCSGSRTTRPTPNH